MSLSQKARGRENGSSKVSGAPSQLPRLHPQGPQKAPGSLIGSNRSSSRCLPGGLCLFGFCLQKYQRAMAAAGAEPALAAGALFKVMVIQGGQAPDE